jgi:hypothetical protein
MTDKSDLVDGKFVLRCERIAPGQPNMNGRIYSAEILQKMVEQVQKKISYGVFFGRLGVSSDPKIRMKDAAFRITQAQIDKKDGHVSVNCEILNTEKGVELEKMLEAQGTSPFEVIPCGVGSVSQRDGFTVIGEDYRIASFDIEPKLEPPKIPEGSMEWPDEETE